MATSSIHEMLSCELTTLGILNLENSQFTKWHQKQSTKTHLPDFILDPGDVDTLSPWQLHLIEGHTFPHHILRTWYNHFDIAMDTTSIEDMYKTLCLLHAGRQAQVELPLILIQVCTDLSLCMLSLMMSETPTAMSHLLQAIGSLHEAGHLHVMQCLLRLFLPQGPKYILKLQQEVTAMRVMISMDTHAHVDGASKVHTIKRYLSEHKDESVINTSNLRCRELDCLRAYYYIAIINFLKESCFSGETADSATSSDKTDGDYSSPDTQLSDVSDIDTKVESKLTPEKEMKVASERVRVSPGKDGSSMAGVKVKAETGTKVENNNISDSMKESSNSTKTITPAAPAQSNACVVKVSSESEKKAQGTSSKSNPPDSINDRNKTSERNCDSSAKNQVQDQKADTKCDNKSESKGIADVLIGSGPRTGSPSSKSPSQSKESSPTTALSDSSTQTTRLMSEQTSIIPTNQKHSLRCQTIPVLNVNHYSITVARLSQLSQGLLWDLQAKRFALTETLGYIHKAISQLLLSKNSQSSDTLSGMDSESGEGQSGDKDGTGLEADGEGSSQGQGQTNRQTSSSGKTGDDGGLEARTKSKSRDRSSADGVSNGEKDGSGAAMATEKSMKKASQPGSSKSQHKTADTYLCDHHHHNFGDHHHNFGEHAEGELCHSVLSYHFDQMLNIHVPHVGEVPVHMGETDTETDFKCSFFEVCSSCELLHKSRKILFDDEPRSHTRPEVPGIKDMTNITNPAKYINVPDEWYGMPVDQKYFKRYITMAILKDEQEYVMRELKRAPDNTQSPFPNPLESVATLLDLAGHSSHVGTVARQEYVQKVITWALNFAVTTQQKQTFLNVLQTHLES